MGKKNNHQNNSDQKEQDNRRFRITARNNMKKHEIEQKLKKNNGIAWEQDGITYVDGRIYIPNNKKIKEQILQENHDPADVGYLEQQRMMELVKRNY